MATLGDGAQLKRMANWGARGVQSPHCSPLAHGINFSVRKRACPFLPTMMGSCTNIPSGGDIDDRAGHLHIRLRGQGSLDG